MASEIGQCSIENVAAYIIEIDIYALRTMLAQGLRDILVLVVNRVIKTQIAGDVLALLRAACDTHSAAAFDFGDLAYRYPHSPGGTGNHNCLSGFGLSNFEQAEISCQSSSAEHADINGQWRELRIDFGHIAAVGQSIFLHAKDPGHMVTYG